MSDRSAPRSASERPFAASYPPLRERVAIAIAWLLILALCFAFWAGLVGLVLWAVG